MPYKYLLFDFDGVLVDSFQASHAAQRATSAPLDETAYRKLFHGNIYETLDSEVKEVIMPKYEDDHPFFKIYTPKLLEQPPVAGIDQALARLTERHVLAMVTSSLDSAVQTYLDRYNLAHHFDTVLGVNVHKSKLAKIKMVCDMYDGRPHQCLFITDTLGDMREATKAGVESVGVSWGFHDVETLQQGKPLGIAHTPTELCDLIEERSAL